MVKVGVLTCPVCGSRCRCGPGAVRDAAALKSASVAHLSRHGIPESKRGIYAVKMVRDVSVTTSEDPPARDGAGEWVEPASAAHRR